MQELVRKGVSKEDIEAGMRQVFGDEAQKLHVFDDDVSDGAAHDGGESEQRRPPYSFDRKGLKPFQVEHVPKQDKLAWWWMWHDAWQGPLCSYLHSVDCR